MRDLERLEVRCCLCASRSDERPHGVSKMQEMGERAWGATAYDDSATQYDMRPTRSVWVFAPPALTNEFGHNGYMSIW